MHFYIILHHINITSLKYFNLLYLATTCSHVLAAYAAFLWETDNSDGTEDGGGNQAQDFAGLSFHHGALASAAT